MTTTWQNTLLPQFVKSTVSQLTGPESYNLAFTFEAKPETDYCFDEATLRQMKLSVMQDQCTWYKPWLPLLNHWVLYLLVGAIAALGWNGFLMVTNSWQVSASSVACFAAVPLVALLVRAILKWDKVDAFKQSMLDALEPVSEAEAAAISLEYAQIQEIEDTTPSCVCRPYFTLLTHLKRRGTPVRGFEEQMLVVLRSMQVQRSSMIKYAKLHADAAREARIARKLCKSRNAR